MVVVPSPSGTSSSSRLVMVVAGVVGTIEVDSVLPAVVLEIVVLLIPSEVVVVVGAFVGTGGLSSSLSSEYQGVDGVVDGVVGGVLGIGVLDS